MICLITFKYVLTDIIILRRGTRELITSQNEAIKTRFLTEHYYAMASFLKPWLAGDNMPTNIKAFVGRPSGAFLENDEVIYVFSKRYKLENFRYRMSENIFVFETHGMSMIYTTIRDNTYLVLKEFRS